MSHFETFTHGARLSPSAFDEQELHRLMARGRRLQAQAMGDALRGTGRAVRAWFGRRSH